MYPWKNDMKLWVDAKRPAPEGWVWVKTAKEAIKILSEGKVKELALDHDLGLGAGNGYQVICWLEEVVLTGFYLVAYGKCPPTIKCHSQNPVGKIRIEAAIRSIDKYMYSLNRPLKK